MSTLFLSLRKVSQLGDDHIQKFNVDAWEGLVKYHDDLLGSPARKRHSKYRKIQLRLRGTDGDEVMLWEWTK